MAPKLAISKTQDAIKTVTDGLNTPKDNLGDLFDAEKLKYHLQYLNDRANDFFNTWKQTTIDTMNKLGTGLRSMDKFKNTVNVMLTGISKGADLATGLYKKKWEEIEKKR